MQISRFVLKLLGNKKNLGIRNCGIQYSNISNIRSEVYSEKKSSVPDSLTLDERITIEKSALDTAHEDLSSITPYFPQSFNVAAYVNNSESLQNLVHLNVDLSKIEKKPYLLEKILKLNFENDIKKHIFFLKDYVEEIGIFITKNPLILCEKLEDIQVRINYLQSKRFSHSDITRIVSKNPFWLMYSTKRIDRRLGYFQGKFTLSGPEVRHLSTRQPKIITYNLQHINTNTFVIKEEMGFEDNEVKQLILNKPKLWMISQKSLLERFNYIHNVMKIPHSTVLETPHLLLFRNFKVKQRHQFLEKLGRAQYDPKKENYVPITALIEGTDVEFCKKYAKCNIDDFNIFLKTL